MGIRRERHGNVEVAVIDRPEKRNALDPPTIDALGQVLLDVEADDAVAVLVLTGAGDRAFCAGMDLASWSAGRQVLRGPGAARYEAFYRTGLRKPVVAALNGSAVGGGFELMLACDLVVAADHAMLGLPEVRRGLFAGAGGTLLAKRVPLAAALEILLTGELVDASRAASLGLVNRVVPAAEVLPTALALASTIAANAPIALEITKRLVHHGLDHTHAEAWVEIEAALAQVLVTDDAREGARAFVEKRTPRWTGR